MDKYKCPTLCENGLLPDLSGLEFHAFCQNGAPVFVLEPEGQKKLFLDTGDGGLLVEAQAFFLWGEESTPNLSDVLVHKATKEGKTIFSQEHLNRILLCKTFEGCENLFRVRTFTIL